MNQGFTRLTLLITGYLALAGCGRYADFTLPPPPAGPEIRFEWQVRPEPVLSRGAAGSWDSSDVLNPSVIRFGPRYLNLFSGFDGKVWRTGTAWSDDGIAWRTHGSVLAPDRSGLGARVHRRERRGAQLARPHLVLVSGRIAAADRPG